MRAQTDHELQPRKLYQAPFHLDTLLLSFIIIIIYLFIYNFYMSFFSNLCCRNFFSSFFSVCAFVYPFGANIINYNILIIIIFIVFLVCHFSFFLCTYILFGQIT